MMESIMAKKFFDIAAQLDILKKIEKPTVADVERLSKYLTGIEYTRYFFYDLYSPEWVTPLHNQGLFSQPPAPLEDVNQPGYFSMPIWHEGEYLKKNAEIFPEIVKQVALKLDTENSRAIRTLLEALLMVHPRIVAETISSLKRWAKTPFVSFMSLSNEFGLILEYLARGSQVNEALQVLNIISEPFENKLHQNEGKVLADTRLDPYFLQESFNNNLPVLIEVDPIGVLKVIESQLIKSIDLEQYPNTDEKDLPLASYWRYTINPESDVNSIKDFKNLLVDTMIFALDKSCEQKKPEVREILLSYINNEYSILRRISIYILRSWGNQHTDLVEMAYKKHVADPIFAGQSEVQRLIDSQFILLPKSIQKEILGAIKSGPPDDWVDNLISKHSEELEGDRKQKKRQSLVDKWKLREYDHISSFLEGEEKKVYESLIEKYGKPEPIPEGFVTSSWVGPESPVDLDYLSKKSIEEVILLLVNFTPSGEDTFGKPSREGFGRVFEEDVKARAINYLENAQLLIRDDLHFVYHTHFFRGLETIIKSQENYSLTNLISLCEFITHQEEDYLPKQEYEPGIQSAKLSVANIIEKLLERRDSAIENEILNRIGSIIIDLLNQEDPYLDEENTSMDPATRSLNSSRGMAMHSIVMFGLYCVRKQKIDQDIEIEPFMDPLVKETLTEKLDKSKYPSLAIHSVFGWYFPQLIYLDKDWSLENLERIFPSEPNKVIYWKSAWSAYIRFTDLFINVFPVLIPQYRRAINEIQNLDKEVSWDRDDNNLATHILKAYLFGLISLDSNDELISMYYLKADDDIRSRGNFWLSQVLESQKPSAEDDSWNKIWKLWQWRLEELSTVDDRSKYKKEITSFCRFLKNTPLDLQNLYPVLKQTLDYKATDYEFHLIIEYLGKNCEIFPSLAIILLHEIVLTRHSLYFPTDIKNIIEKILYTSMNTDRKTKDKAIEIINVFGEHGYYDWRPLLDKLK